jgi:GTP-binding protein HflX
VGDHDPSDNDRSKTPLASDHRGAFGDYGGESSGLIDRTFRERIVLVGVTMPEGSDDETHASLDELALLVDTAGADAVGRIHQRRQAPDPATFVGKGKVQEIKDMSLSVDSDTVVFDDELSPAQQGNLEKILGRSALDRTAVILDIFAQNASSSEGKAQVELAQLKYRLPRLRSSSRTFSQQGGGIGTRGPGETQLEVDRRRLVRRVHKLEDVLRKLDKNRKVQSKARKRTSNRRVALVGYTNAGKSSVLNRLTDADVLAEDRLFATLDATTRRLQLPGGEMLFLTDTVGFVRKLPTQLVEAFKSTLDVVIDADLLLHIVDASAPDMQGNIDAVRRTLNEIGASDVPELMVFNKIDIQPEVEGIVSRYPGSVAVSAHDGTGLDVLIESLSDRLRSMTELVQLSVPYERGDVLAQIHREGQVLSELAGETSITVRARLDPDSKGRLVEWLSGADEVPPLEPDPWE